MTPKIRSEIRVNHERAARLRSVAAILMTGIEPLDRLPKMYNALQCYAGPFDQVQQLMRKACLTLENHDVKEFGRFRMEVLNMSQSLFAGDGGAFVRS